MKYFVYVLLLIAAFIVFASFKGSKRVSMIGKEVPAFRLNGIDGKQVSTAGYKNAKGFIIVFTCNHCPFAKLYTRRLNALNTKYKALGVPLLAVNAMDSLVYDDENAKGMRVWARSQHYNFPYLQDGTQEVAKSFNAAHTPQAFVIWDVNGKWVVRYSGAIDDNGQHPEKAKPFVADAVNALLLGKEPPVTENLSFGCAIHYR